MAKLDKVTIRGFKSIEKLENFELGSLNVLIGANGAGKSNFVEFFRLLRAMVEERLQEYMLKNAPADGYLHNGIKVTRSIEAEMVFGQNRYGFALEPAADGRLIINREVTQYLPSAYSNVISNGALESGLVKRKDDPGLLGRHGANWWVWRSVSS